MQVLLVERENRPVHCEQVNGGEIRIDYGDDRDVKCFPTNGWLVDGTSVNQLQPPTEDALFDRAFIWLSEAAWYRDDLKFDLHSRPLYSGWMRSSGNSISEPWIDRWFPNNDPKFSLGGLTMDVDCLFKYLGRPLWKKWGGMVRDFPDLQEISNRIQVIMGFKRDPWIISPEAWPLSRVFLLLAQGGDFNPNISVQNDQQKGYIKNWGNKELLSLHPSYHVIQSKPFSRPFGIQKQLLLLEKNKLVELTDGQCDVLHFRNHYLRSSPEWYRFMASEGFRYAWNGHLAGIPGWYQGTMFPFNWYDLENEKTSPLKIIPAGFMDVDAQIYLSLSPEKSLDLMRKLKEMAKEVQGEMVTICHNESLSSSGPWKNWEPVFKAASAP